MTYTLAAVIGLLSFAVTAAWLRIRTHVKQFATVEARLVALEKKTQDILG